MKQRRRLIRQGRLLSLCLLSLAGHFVPGLSRAIPLLERLSLAEADRPFGGRSATESPLAAYYSPALLPRSGQRLSVSLVLLHEHLSISTLPRPPGYDVPDSVYRARLPNGVGFEGPISRSLPTSKLPNARPSETLDERLRPTLVAGYSSSLIEDRLSLGFVMVSPVGIFQSQRPFFADEREQFFSNRLYHEFSGDRLEITTFALGLAYHPLPELSLGLGATLGNRAESVAQIYLPDAGDQERAETNPQVSVEPLLNPHLSLSYRPRGDESVSLSTSVHFPSQSRLEGRGMLRFWDFEYPEGQDALAQPFELAFTSQPLRVSLGGQWSHALSARESLALYGELLWAQWSAYENRHAERARGWADTLSGSLGARLTLDQHSWGAGLSYAPSPVPEQDGRTNYVDNDRLGGQLGWRWRLPLEGERAIAFGLSLQLQRLLEREHFKRRESNRPVGDELFDRSVDVQSGAPLPEAAGLQTNNPGFPGFKSSGWMSTGLFTLTLEG